MNLCPICNSELEFDIYKRRWVCKCYDSPMVSDVIPQEDILDDEPTYYEATRLSCPQCGNEILGKDGSPFTFCSFCGSDTLLTEPKSKERSPKYIIPFATTEEECIAAYKKKMRWAPFVPKAMKQAKHFETLRGIYMPYWVYSYEQKGNISFIGSQHLLGAHGDYLINYYNLECFVEGEYTGIAYNAVRNFSDYLGDAIEPFELSAAQPFTPASSKHFYVNAYDTDADYHEDDAKSMIADYAANRIHHESEVTKQYSYEPDIISASLNAALYPQTHSRELALFPIWLLPYHMGERSAYTVINGQTGKLAADLPVATGKYLFGSLLLAIPLFFLIDVLLKSTSLSILLLTVIFALLCCYLSGMQLKQLDIKEQASEPQTTTQEQAHNKLHKLLNKRMNTKRAPLLAGEIIVYLCMYVMLVWAFSKGRSFRPGINIYALIPLPFLAIFFVLGYIWGHSIVYRPKHQASFLRKSMLTKLLKPFLTLILSTVCFFLNPVSEVYYYVSAIFCTCAIIWVIIDMVKRHNILATHKTPIHAEKTLVTKRSPKNVGIRITFFLLVGFLAFTLFLFPGKNMLIQPLRYASYGFIALLIALFTNLCWISLFSLLHKPKRNTLSKHMDASFYFTEPTAKYYKQKKIYRPRKTPDPDEVRWRRYWFF